MAILSLKGLIGKNARREKKKIGMKIPRPEGPGKLETDTLVKCD